MQIKLIRSGGFIPILKTAVTNVNWTKEDIQKILLAIEVTEEEYSAKRDTVFYTLDIEGQKYTVDLTKVPEQYKSILNWLLKNLEVDKSGK